MRIKDLPSIPFHKTCNCEDGPETTWADISDLVEAGVPICGWCGDDYELDWEEEI